MRNKFCIDKKLLILIMLVFIFFSVTYLVRQINGTKTTDIKAAGLSNKTLLNDKDCVNKYPLSDQPIKPIGYISSKDNCPIALCNSRSGFVLEIDSSCNYGQGKCCRAVGTGYERNYKSINDGYCQQVSADKNAVCVAKEVGINCPKGKTELGIPCKAKNSSLGLVNGKCCGVLNPTDMPTPRPADQPGKQVKDCGPHHHDCTKTWAATTNNSRILSSDGKTNFTPVCLGDNENDINTFECALNVGQLTKCDGYQYADPVYLSTINGGRGGADNTCYITNKLDSDLIRNNGFRTCKFYAQAGLTSLKCRQASDANK